jgi:phenylacetate-CoA ligase
VCSTFGVAQVDNDLGQPATPGEVGNLIHTGLTNLSMPLLRYWSGDAAVAAAGACRCGRAEMTLSAIHGRKDDAIRTADGRIMPRAGLDQIHEFTPNIEQCQIVQENIDRIAIRVVPGPSFAADDAQLLRTQLAKRLGITLDIHVEIVERLELSPSGKLRFVISRLPPPGVDIAGGGEPVG